MNYLNTETMDYPVTIEKIKMANPLTLFPEPFEPIDPYVLVAPTEQPEHDPVTHRVVEVDPAQKDGGWHQAWEIVALTQNEIDAARLAAVPQSVARAQGKAALIGAGMWTGVLTFVASIEDDTERALAEVALHDTQQWQRSSPFLNSAKAGLGLSDAQLDDLFLAASKIEL